MDGLILKRNEQKHRVVRLHYSADPTKNPQTPQGKTWYDRETAKLPGGASSLLWRREMEIDFGAGSGELVFPEFFGMEDEIVCDPFVLDNTYNFFGGFDWGVRNPSSFHVYAEALDGTCYSVWEYYDLGKTVPYVAEAIRRCPYYDRINWISSDPSIWTENQMRKDSITSIAAMMQDEEEVGAANVIDKLTPAHDRSDIGAISRFKTLWGLKPVKFKIFRSCVNQISEFKNLKYPERKETTNETEKILDKNNHTWDDAKYFVLSHPFAKVLDDKPKFGTIAYINSVTDQAAQIAKMTGRSVQEEFNELYGQ